MATAQPPGEGPGAVSSVRVTLGGGALSTRLVLAGTVTSGDTKASSGVRALLSGTAGCSPPEAESGAREAVTALRRFETSVT